MTRRMRSMRVVAGLLAGLGAACGGGSSSGSTSASAPELPGPPGSVFAVASSRSVTLTWSAPASTGGAKITGYTVVADPAASPVTTTGATTATIAGLTNGTPYVFQVAATTTNGTGPGALSNIVIPGGGLPASAPIGVIAVARDGEAEVDWAAPASPGGSAISGYWLTVTPGGVGQPSKTTSLLVRGLANGTTYVFSVEALNAAGASANTSSNPVTPTAGTGFFDGGAPDGAPADAARAADATLRDGGPDAGGDRPTTDGPADDVAGDAGRDLDARARDAGGADARRGDGATRDAG